MAAGVLEAVEHGARCMLIDEDLSAANFMSLDGRMRSLVGERTLTPLLYRVNGMWGDMGIR